MTTKKKGILGIKNIIKVICFLVAVGLLIFYFKIFFTEGIRYDDTFLRKEVKGTEIHYAGKGQYGDMLIIVEGQKGALESGESVGVHLWLPNDVEEHYYVNTKGSNGWLTDIEIRDSRKSLVFEGSYDEEGHFLYDKGGTPYLDDTIRFFVSGESPYNKEYNSPYINIVNLARFTEDTIRGRLELLFIAIVLLAITAIDIRFPLLFFKLEHFMSVRNPEPSDFYLGMQKIGRVLYPVIAIILMIVAI